MKRILIAILAIVLVAWLLPAQAEEKQALMRKAVIT